MKFGILAKTNSWHWLAAALVVSGALSGVLWQREVRHLTAEHQPKLARQLRHLEELKAMDESSVATLERQTKQLSKRLAALKQAVAEAGFPEIPEGTASVMETTNAFDRRLHEANLRIVSSATEAPAERTSPQAATTAKAGGRTTPGEGQPQLSAAEYAKQMNAMIAALPADLREAAQKDARRKIAQMEAAEKQAAKKAARQASKASTQTVTKAAPAPVKLPFQTQEISYVVEGQYKDIFLFLVREAARKSPYHLHNLALTKAPKRGVMRMSFSLQANYR